MKSLLFIFCCLLTGISYGQNWLLTGNAVAPGQFIGTTNYDDMRFRSNNVQRMRILRDGSVSIDDPAAGLNASDFRTNLLVGSSNTCNTNSAANTVSGWTNRVQQSGALLVAGMENVAVNAGKGCVLGWKNVSQNYNQYVIGAANSATQEYSGILGVGLTTTARGAWYLGGAAGTVLTNATDNTLAIGWGGQHTALFDGNGLTLGTATGGITGPADLATARIDVNALPFAGFPSGVRFRDLPVGSGTVLVVDPNGYVYRSNTMVNKTAGSEALEAKVNELEKQLAQLQQQIQQMQNQPAGKMVVAGNNSLTVSPTPFNGKATVSYVLENHTGAATLQVLDSKGVLLQSIPLRQAAGQVQVQQPAVAGSTLVFSIIMDGRPVITRQALTL